MLRVFSEGLADTSLKSYLVGFRNLHTEQDLNLMRSYGGKLKFSFSSINAIAVKLPEGVVERISGLSNVRYIEESGVAFTQPKANCHTPSSLEIPWGINKIGARQVHSQGNRGTGVKVCVIDTGIDYNHRDIKPNYKGGYNTFNSSNNPMDDHGHGTHCSGTIAGAGIGVIGVAPEAYLYGVKVLDSGGSGPYDNVIAGIQWATDNKMQVISMSLGGSQYSQAMCEACERAYQSGIVVVVAAGNNGKGKADTCGYPAKCNPCIAVGATDSNDQSASFSSQGPAVEVSAPGVGVFSTVSSGGNSCCSDPSGYCELSGTSMATPHVAGLTALIIKAHPNFTAQNVRGALNAGVVDLGSSGRDHVFGFGRIDAVKAVSISNPPSPPPYMYARNCKGAGRSQTCEQLPVKGLDSCTDQCDCLVKRWVCRDWAGRKTCGLQDDPICRNSKGFDSLRDCTNYCQGGGGPICNKPTLSFGVN